MQRQVYKIKPSQTQNLEYAVNQSPEFVMDIRDIHVRAPPDDFPTTFKRLFPTMKELPRLLRLIGACYSRPVAHVNDETLVLMNSDYPIVTSYYGSLLGLAKPYLADV